MIANVPRLSGGLSNPKLDPPSETQLKVVRQLIASAYIDQVAVRADLVSNTSVTSASLTTTDERTAQMLWRLRNSGGGERMSSTRGVPYRAMGVPGYAFIHPSSSFFHHAPPAWLVFGEVHRSAGKVALSQDGTVWLKTLTKINPAWLTTLGRSLCSFSKPVEVPGSTGLVNALRAAKEKEASAAKAHAPTRSVMLTPTYAVGSEEDGMAGGLGWELPAIKVTQTLVTGRWETNV